MERKPVVRKPPTRAKNDTPNEANGKNATTVSTDQVIKKISSTFAPPSPIASASSRPGRLVSILPERNLTLTGAGTSLQIKTEAPKSTRVFKPTIPTRRNKPQETVKEEKPAEKPVSGRGRGRGGAADGQRGRGRGKPELIQTQGSVFGDGIADMGMKRGSSSYYGEKESSSAAAMEKPKFTNKAAQVNREEEEATLKDLLRDDFIDDGGLPAHEILPMQLPKSCFKQDEESEEDEVEEQAVAAIDGVKIKQEKTEEDSKTIVAVKRKIAPAGRDYQRRLKPNQVTASQMFQKNGDILFIQLPDVLPSLKGEKERPPQIKLEPGTSTSQQSKPVEEPPTEEVKSEKDGVFDNIPEGRLGTLRIHKSGKLSLQLGEYSFFLDSATQMTCLQDLISVDVNAEEKTGKMMALGPIRYKAVCLPEWDQFFNET